MVRRYAPIVLLAGCCNSPIIPENVYIPPSSCSEIPVFEHEDMPKFSSDRCLDDENTEKFKGLIDRLLGNS